MRIAFLVHVFPELTEAFILNQVTGLIDAGHEVDIYASRPGKASKVHTDVDRYRLLERTRYWDFPHSYLLRAVKAAGLTRKNGWRRAAVTLASLHGGVRFLRQRRYDIVHCQFGTLAPAASALHDIGAMSGGLVVAFRGWDLTSKRVGALDDREVFEKAHLLLPVCESFKARLLERGCDPKKIRVHHSGIKLPLFAYRARRPPTDGPARVLSVGRLVEKKGVADAIRAVARLKASGRRVMYTVVGDGPLRAPLERMVDELGLVSEVQLLGPRSQEEIIGLLQDTHLFVAPSVTTSTGNQEGIPNVLKEAMATGIPVIGTQHSGIPELVEDGVSGLLVPERDSDALADRLAYLMEHPERWPAMGRAGRERVEAEFDSDTLNEELVGLYEEVRGRISSGSASV